MEFPLLLIRSIGRGSVCPFRCLHRSSSAKESPMRITKVALLLVISLALLAPAGFGQATDANLVGVVRDPTSAPVQNAAVDLENLATGLKLTAHTNPNGEYRFNNIPVGRYKVTASAGGFNPA